MNTRHIFVLLLISLLPSLTPSTTAAKEPPLSGNMVMVGEWHGEEVSAKDGESWLALLKTATGFVLQEVEIAVVRVEDAVLDIPPAKTGKKVTVTGGMEPIVLLHSLPQLKAGPVSAADLGRFL